MLYDPEGEQIFSNATIAHPTDEQQQKTNKGEDVLNQLWKSAGYGATRK